MTVIDGRLSEALLRQDDAFLLLLRCLNWLMNSDPSRRAELARKIALLDNKCQGLDLARELNLLSGTGMSMLQLTDLGKGICDGVKQYANWREHREVLPRGVHVEMVRGSDMLDVGCGVGCAMLAFRHHGASRLAGVDLTESHLGLSRIFAEREQVTPPLVTRSDAVALPFQNESFDFVFCRLVLTYVRNDAALSEMARVARDGATLVICLTTLRWDIRQLFRSIRARRWKSVAVRMFCLANGVLFHGLRRQVTWHHHGGMHGEQSPIFHTPRTVRRELRRWGFEPVWDDARTVPSVPTFRAVRRRRIKRFVPHLGRSNEKRGTARINV